MKIFRVQGTINRVAGDSCLEIGIIIMIFFQSFSHEKVKINQIRLITEGFKINRGNRMVRKD